MNGLSVVGAVLISVSKVAKSFEVLIVGRLVFGMFIGLGMSMNPLYIQEVSPTILKGAVATTNTLGILVGMVRTLHEVGCMRLVVVLVDGGSSSSHCSSYRVVLLIVA